MKKIILFAAMFALAVTTSSCELDLYPDSRYNEGNTKTEGEADTAITTRELMQGQVTAMYTYMRGDMQTFWYQLMTLADARADNAYGGNLGEAKVVTLEANRLDSDNEFPVNMWNYCMNGVDKANQVICNIDLVRENDPTMTDTEYREWLSEALVFRAYMWIHMMNMFGEIPMLTVLPPAITSKNIEEVYPLYYPSRVSQQTVGAQIIADLEDYACANAPAVSVSDKFKITKGFAHGVMAKFYAMREFRDWSKVITHCEAVEALGYSLCDNYGDLWAYDSSASGIANKNLKESIFEVNWPGRSSGSWMWMMFFRNAYNPTDSFSWAKWCTPSRNLTKAYDAEGDAKRKEASIAWAECGWSYHYDKDDYAFMNKVPTNVTPIYLLRLADILLLHAEALVNADTPNPGAAAVLVKRVRDRVGLPDLDASVKASAELMKEAVLNERRLELSFEGHRWFDLMRFGSDYSKLKEISDGANVKGSPSYDSYSQTRKVMDDDHVLLPIPTTIMSKNVNLEQNPGY